MLFTAENPIRVLLVMEPHAAHWVRDQIFIVNDIEIIDVTSSGERGLDLVKSSNPDIVLVGLELADMKGADFLAKLAHSLPAVAVSVGGISSATARQAVLMGASDVLVTPNTEQLANTIRNVVLTWTIEAPIKATGDAEVADLESKPEVKHTTFDSKVICFFSPKGGVGTSHLAAAVARALQTDFQYQTALLDLGSAYGVQASLFDIPEAEYVNMEHLAVGADPQDLLLRHSSGMYLVAGAPSSMVSATLQREQVERLIRYLRDRCDIVVIDSGPALDFHTRVAFDSSDIVLLVTTPEPPAMQSLKSFFDFATETLRYPSSLFKVILNKSSAKLEAQVNYAQFASKARFSILHRVPLLDEGGAALLGGASIDEVLKISKTLVDSA